MDELRGRTLLLLGDSLTHQWYEGMLIELGSRNLSFAQSAVMRDPIPYRDGNTVGVEQHAPATAVPTLVMVCASLNFTLVLQEFWEMVTPPPFEMLPVKDKNFVSWQTVDELLRRADVSITNIGVHYDIGDPNDSQKWRREQHTYGHEVKEKRLGYILRRIREERGRRPKSCHILRKTFHQHFPGGSGSGIFYELNVTLQGKMRHTTGEVCLADAAYELEDMSSELLSRYPEVPILNYSTLDRLGAGRFKSGRWGRDCTHFCWSTRFYDPVWYLFLGVLREACPR
jgi:hypothetical protein